ncbi:DUF6531 domain-containing protein [Eubacteriales bacterium OttesenSCG-928-M02]|nr:DUF6531 domain-containing protein [Eubacteriales bacterium OttesenSCG-928-M02]
MEYQRWEKGEAALEVIPLSGLVLAERTYYLRVTATDNAGNVSVLERSFNLLGNATYETPKLKLTSSKMRNGGMQHILEGRQVNFSYTPINGYTLPAAHTVELYVDGKRVPKLTSIPMVRVLTVDVLAPENANLFQPGEIQTIHVVVRENATGRRVYSESSFLLDNDIPLITSSFDALDGFHVSNNQLKVTSLEPGGDGFMLKEVKSGLGVMNRIKITGEGLPDDVELVFDVQFYDGEQYGEAIRIENGTEYIPQGLFWGYKITGRIADGGTHNVGENLAITDLTVDVGYMGYSRGVETSLVKKPEQLSATGLANYTIWVRWNPSQTAGARYDVYRRERGSNEETLVASDITESYYYDFNLLYERWFEYRVVAKKDFKLGSNTQTATSAVSNWNDAQVVAEDELEKSLGLQNYWSYVTTPAGNGTGYVNVDSGNLVYQKTDFALTAPLLASVMTRSYNSQALSESGTGKGWDFGFNTNLLVEYDMSTSTPTPIGMILKDGDGTLHRFRENEDGSFETPQGVFMTLERVEDDDEISFRLTRADDIVYLFNKSNMIHGFEEPNGNKLTFTYDTRGRLELVKHSIYSEGTMLEMDHQYIRFTYPSNPMGGNIDKVERAIVYYGNNGETLETQVYHYQYGLNPDEASYKKLTEVATNNRRPVLALDSQLQPGAVALHYETVRERYIYEKSDTDGGFTVVTHANESPLGTKEYRFSLDEGDRVTGMVNAKGDGGRMTYEETGDIRTTTMVSHAQGHDVETIVFKTDHENNGVLLETIGTGDRRTVFSDHNGNLQVEKITTYRRYENGQYLDPVESTAAYDDKGNITWQVDPLGRKTVYKYQTGTNWMTETQLFDAQGNLMNWAKNTYDANGNVVTTTALIDPDDVDGLTEEDMEEGNIEIASLSSARTTTYEYDGNGQMVKATSWNGSMVTYGYDNRGRLAHTTTSGAGESFTTRYEYDLRNHPTKSIVDRGTADSIITNYRYDDLGYLMETVVPTGQRQYSFYNRNGMLVENVVIGYDVDQTGTWSWQQSYLTKYSYDNADRLVETTNPDGTVVENTTHVSDSALSAGSVFRGEDIIRTSRISATMDGTEAMSLSISGEEELGSKSYYDYEGNAWKSVQVHKGENGYEEERPTYARYDLLGRVIQMGDTPLDGTQAAKEHTTLGQAESQRQVEGKTEYDIYGNVFRSWTYVETENNVRQYTVKEYAYDLAGRVTQVKEYVDLQSGATPSGTVQTTGYRYDVPDGSLWYNEVTDAEGGISKTYGDQLGRTVKEEQLGRSTGGNVNIVKEYVYDAYGRMVAIKAGNTNGTTTRQTYEYDKYDRLVKQKSNNSLYTTYKYDYFNRRIEMIDQVGTEEYGTYWQYNTNGEVYSLTQDGKTVRYYYNDAGEMKLIQYMDGNQEGGIVRSIGYAYDGFGRLTAIHSGNTGEGLLSDGDIYALPIVKAYTYLGNGDAGISTEYLAFDTYTGEMANAPRMTLEHSYDSLGRVVEKVYKEDGVMKERYTASYDGRSYVVSSQYQDNYTTESALSLTRSYTYDAIGRMVESSLTKGGSTDSKVVTYGFDRVGNREYETVVTVKDSEETTETTGYAYNNLSQLLNMSKWEGEVADKPGQPQVQIAYEYDVYGNRHMETQYHIDLEDSGNHEEIGKVEYVYDEANQLIERKAKQGEAAWKVEERNIYNGEGQRIRKYNEDSDVFTKYFYMGGALAFTTPGGANQVTDENILTPSGQIVAGMRKLKGDAGEGSGAMSPGGDGGSEGSGESRYWVNHYDMQGSVTNIVGANGDNEAYRVEQNIYDPFGKDESLIQKAEEDSIENEVKYTGAVEDRSLLLPNEGGETSGSLYYLSARHYDPNTGRFLQQDTYKGDSFNPWTQNLYAYTSNNPVNYIDPTGHSPSNAQCQEDQQILNQINADATTIKKANPGMSDADAWARASRNYWGGGTPESPGTEPYVPYNKNATSVIKDQRDSFFEDWNLGTLGNMIDNGCGVIGIHNYIILSGGKSNIYDVYKYFKDDNSKLVLDGAWGIRWADAMAYISTKVKGNGCVDGTSVYLIRYIWSDEELGGHYVAATEKDGEYTVYNVGDGTEKAKGRSVIPALAETHPEARIVLNIKVYGKYRRFAYEAEEYHGMGYPEFPENRDKIYEQMRRDMLLQRGW